MVLALVAVIIYLVPAVAAAGPLHRKTQTVLPVVVIDQEPSALAATHYRSPLVQDMAGEPEAITIT